MNKELILMLVLSFVVGYIVSEVVRKCGCNIVEGARTGAGPDPGNSPLPEEIGYDDPPCNFGLNTPRKACTASSDWIQYKPKGGIKKGACKWECPGTDLGIYAACSEDKPAIPFDKWNGGEGCINSDSS